MSNASDDESDFGDVRGTIYHSNDPEWDDEYEQQYEQKYKKRTSSTSQQQDDTNQPSTSNAQGKQNKHKHEGKGKKTRKDDSDEQLDGDQDDLSPSEYSKQVHSKPSKNEKFDKSKLGTKSFRPKLKATRNFPTPIDYNGKWKLIEREAVSTIFSNISHAITYPEDWEIADFINDLNIDIIGSSLSQRRKVLEFVPQENDLTSHYVLESGELTLTELERLLSFQHSGQHLVVDSGFLYGNGLWAKASNLFMNHITSLFPTIGTSYQLATPMPSFIPKLHIGLQDMTYRLLQRIEEIKNAKTNPTLFQNHISSQDNVQYARMPDKFDMETYPSYITYLLNYTSIPILFDPTLFFLHVERLIQLKDYSLNDYSLCLYSSIYPKEAHVSLITYFFSLGGDHWFISSPRYHSMLVDESSCSLYQYNKSLQRFNLIWFEAQLDFDNFPNQLKQRPVFKSSFDGLAVHPAQNHALFKFFVSIAEKTAKCTIPSTIFNSSINKLRDSLKVFLGHYTIGVYQHGKNIFSPTFPPDLLTTLRSTMPLSHFISFMSKVTGIEFEINWVVIAQDPITFALDLVSTSSFDIEGDDDGELKGLIKYYLAQLMKLSKRLEIVQRSKTKEKISYKDMITHSNPFSIDRYDNLKSKVLDFNYIYGYHVTQHTQMYHGFLYHDQKAIIAHHLKSLLAPYPSTKKPFRRNHTTYVEDASATVIALHHFGGAPSPVKSYSSLPNSQSQQFFDILEYLITKLGIVANVPFPYYSTDIVSGYTHIPKFPFETSDLISSLELGLISNYPTEGSDVLGEDATKISEYGGRFEISETPFYSTKALFSYSYDLTLPRDPNSFIDWELGDSYKLYKNKLPNPPLSYVEHSAYKFKYINLSTPKLTTLFYGLYNYLITIKILPAMMIVLGAQQEPILELAKSLGMKVLGVGRDALYPNFIANADSFPYRNHPNIIISDMELTLNDSTLIIKLLSLFPNSIIAFKMLFSSIELKSSSWTKIINLDHYVYPISLTDSHPLNREYFLICIPLTTLSFIAQNKTDDMIAEDFAAQSSTVPPTMFGATPVVYDRLYLHPLHLPFVGETVLSPKKSFHNSFLHLRYIGLPSSTPHFYEINASSDNPNPEVVNLLSYVSPNLDILAYFMSTQTESYSLYSIPSSFGVSKFLGVGFHNKKRKSEIELFNRTSKKLAFIPKVKVLPANNQLIKIDILITNFFEGLKLSQQSRIMRSIGTGVKLIIEVGCASGEQSLFSGVNDGTLYIGIDVEKKWVYDSKFLLVGDIVLGVDDLISRVEALILGHLPKFPPSFEILSTLTYVLPLYSQPDQTMIIRAYFLFMHSLYVMMKKHFPKITSSCFSLWMNSYVYGPGFLTLANSHLAEEPIIAPIIEDELMSTTTFYMKKYPITNFSLLQEFSDYQVIFNQSDFFSGAATRGKVPCQSLLSLWLPLNQFNPLITLPLTYAMKWLVSFSKANLKAYTDWVEGLRVLTKKKNSERYSLDAFRV